MLFKQLLRSRTSIGANVTKALAGESRVDFAYKMSIESKEAGETLYWLELLHKSQIIEREYSDYIEDCTVLVKMLTSIVKSTKNS